MRLSDYEQLMRSERSRVFELKRTTETGWLFGAIESCLYKCDIQLIFVLSREYK